nr:mini-cAMPase [synthetic construct]
MYGKLNDLLEDLQEVLKNLHKNDRSGKDNIHDVDNHLQNVIEDIHDFMQAAAAAANCRK